MANYHSTNQKPLYKSSKRSAIDAYLPEQPSSIPSSRYLSSFTDPNSLSSYPSPSSFSYYSQSRTPVSAIDVPAATSGIGASSRTFYPTSTASPIWPSFDVSATPSEALYDHSGDAWLTYNSLAKRPRLENASSLHNYPLRPGEKDCSHYMLTRTCKFGDNCKYDHPIWVPIGGIPDWKEPLSIPSHPERPGEPDCPYFVKTQKCKYGLHCRFNHPKDKVDTSSKTDAPDLPERPSEPVCTFYAKTGMCKYGAACKYHHPKDIQVPSAAQVNVDGVHIQSKDHIGANGDGDALKYMVSNPASSYNTKGLPMRPGQDDCPFYMKTGSCKYGANCRYNHPDWNVINPAAAVVHHAVLPSLGNSVGFGNPASFLQNLQSGLAQTTFGQVPAMYPQRPGQMECDYYMKNGECKYGERCKYHHPIDRYAPTSNQSLGQNVKLTLAGLPRREGAEHCPFYMKTGTCKYGVNCKFDHPPPGEVMASADKESPTKAEEKEKEIGEILETEDKPENGEMSENVEKSENVAADEK